jgi:hypothetical protein
MATEYTVELQCPGYQIILQRFENRFQALDFARQLYYQLNRMRARGEVRVYEHKGSRTTMLGYIDLTYWLHEFKETRYAG